MGVLDARSTTMTVRVETTHKLAWNYTNDPNLQIPPLFLNWKLVSNYGVADMNMTPLRINLNAGNPTMTSTKVAIKPEHLAYFNTQLWGVNVHVTTPGATPETTMSYQTQNTLLRCDDGKEVFDTTPVAGCVNVKWQPNVDFPASQYPNISQNIAAGKAAHNNAGSPGNPLVKVTRAQKNANYSSTCEKPSYYEPLIGARPGPDEVTGDPFECDEYPFASSEQGGPGNTLKWVPAKENSSQGGRLGGLYTTHRVMPGDQFIVN